MVAAGVALQGGLSIKDESQLVTAVVRRTLSSGQSSSSSRLLNVSNVSHKLGG